MNRDSLPDRRWQETAFRVPRPRIWNGGTLGNARELPPQYLDQGLAEPRGRRRHLDPGGLHGGDLGFGIALAARDDGAGMPHAPAGRRGASGDETHHRLLAAALGLVDQELSGVLLGGTADLADHHDRLGRLV